MTESVTLLLAIVALIGVAYVYYWYSPAPPLPPLGAAIRRNTIRVGGEDRTYLTYVPASLTPQSALVIVLHGSGMDGARSIHEALRELAFRERRKIHDIILEGIEMALRNRGRRK